MGRPKALVELDGEPLVVRALHALTKGGVAPVVVVLGARADEVRAVLPAGVRAVEAPDWADGMGASLRAGLESLEDGPEAVIVTLVDLPDVGAEVVRRVLADPVDAATLRRAAYDGTPGHPVLIGRDHWAGVAAAARGDRGARDYLAAHATALVECGDLATGVDVDSPTFGQPRRQ